MQKDYKVDILLTNVFNTQMYEQLNKLKFHHPTHNLLLTYQDGEYIKTFQYSCCNKFPRIRLRPYKMFY